MEILYIIDDLEPRYPRDQNYIIKYMLDRGHSVYVITSRSPSEILDYRIFPKACIYRYPSLCRVGTIKIYSMNPLKLLRRYDIVHTFTFYTYSTIPSLASRAKGRVIRSEISHPGARRVRRGLTIFRPLTELYKVFFDVITAYNKREAISLEILGFPREKILLLPPMIDAIHFRKAIRKPGDRLVIGTISRISPEKGLHEIPKILEILDNIGGKDYEFILAGRIENIYYGNIVIKRLKRLLKDRFIYMGELRDPLEFYSKIDVFLFTSTIETGAIAVLEAMAAGKIVISRKIHPVDLYIEDMVTGALFETPIEGAEKLYSIINNTREIYRMQRNAIERALHHDYRVLCKKLEKVYERISK